MIFEWVFGLRIHLVLIKAKANGTETLLKFYIITFYPNFLFTWVLVELARFLAFIRVITSV